MKEAKGGSQEADFRYLGIRQELNRQAKEITGMNGRQDPVDIKHVLFGEYGESMITEIMHTTHTSAHPRYWPLPATVQVY